MPILYTGTTLPLAVSVGQTLVVKELTGTATVTGSSAAREDASSSIGAGFVVYGPQPSAVSLSMTTTGLCEWQIVSGDATPAKGVLRVTLDPITGLDVLDAGSRDVVENSGIDTGHISPGDKYTFPGIDTSSLSTYPQYIASIDAFCLGKSHITKTDLGVISNGVDHMYEYMAGSGPVNVLINCGTHGAEVQSSFAAYIWFKEFCTSNSTLFSSLRKRITVSWIPMVNPSKFRSGRTNDNGVDLNRNNDFYWSRYVPVDPVENAKGASAGSEIETQLRKALIDSRNCVAVIDCHNYWQSFDSNDINTTPPSSFVMHNEAQYRAANAIWLKTYGGTLGTVFVSPLASNPELVNWSAFYNTATRKIPYADSILLECKMEIGGSTSTNLTSAGATLYCGYITTWLQTYLSSMHSMRPLPNHAWGMYRNNDAVGTSISAGGTLLDGANLVFSSVVFDGARPGVGGMPRDYMDCPVLCPGTIEIYADGYIESAGAAQRVDLDFSVDGVATGSQGYCSLTVPGTANQRIAFSMSYKFSVTVVDANYVPRIKLLAARAGAVSTPNIKRARMWARFVPGYSLLEVPAF